MRRSNWLGATAAAFLCSLIPSLASARGEIRMVADLNTDQLPTNEAGAARPAAVGSMVLFAGRTAAQGVELWRTDGTAAGTKIVREIRPGAAGSFPSKAIDVNGIAYFVADDGEHGEELWRSDGTAAGTRLVRDIMPGPLGSDTWNLVVKDGILFFNSDDGEHASELWRSDGTSAGTRMIKDIWPGPEHSGPVRLTVAGAQIFFVANDGVHGNELWVSDGTSGGTRMVTDLRPGAESGLETSKRDPLVVLGNEVYFGGDDGAHGAELWKSDGTAAGTTLVSDIVPGPNASDALPRAASRGRVMFSVTDDRGAHLWSSDGTAAGTRLVAEAGPYRQDDVVDVDGRLFYIANRSSLWASDGTTAGTVLLRDILEPIGCASTHYFDELTRAGNRVFVSTRQTGHDHELWVSDGTVQGTHEVRDIRDPQGGKPRDLAASGDSVYFVANDGEHGFELWRSDGTEANTQLVADLLQTTANFFPGFRDGAPLAPLGKDVYFAENDRLYRSDGTAQGTGIAPGTEALTVATVDIQVDLAVARAGERIYFWATSPSLDLWTADGTPGGTALVQRTTSSLASGVTFRNDFYFTAGRQPGVGAELWRTSGTSASIVKDIVPGAGDSSPALFTPAANQLFFVATDGASGRELWRTDGTEAGTRLVKDIAPGLSSGIYENVPPVAGGDVIYFIGSDPEHGREIWRSDGTAAGTYLLEDSAPGPASGFDESNTILAAAENGRLFLLRSREDVSDYENYDLWTSDGSPNSLTFVARFPWAWWIDQGLQTLGNIAYFAVRETGPGIIWQSDGTSAGTHAVEPQVEVDDMAKVDGALYLMAAPSTFARAGTDLWRVAEPGGRAERVATLSGDFTWLSLESLVNADGRLFLVGDDGVHGAELFAVSCGDGAVQADEQCDEGDHNGATGSRCSQICELATSGRIWHRVPRISDGGGPPPGRGLLGPRPHRSRVLPHRE